MLINIQNLPRVIFKTFAVCALLVFSGSGLAWSPDGHSAIGILAMKQLQPEAREGLREVIGSLDDEAMIKACNWPDDVRETETWDWSAPQHYINIPRGEFEYQESRDCADQLCATEAIKSYADQIFDERLTNEKRGQAFAWLCHVTGDLHQPLHAGFADDRGGNNYQVIFQDLEINLHRFWDHELIDEFAGGWQVLVAFLSAEPFEPAPANWSRSYVDQWTEESHRLATEQVYPPGRTIDQAFALHSWKLAQRQVALAAYRLALIINSEFDQDKN